jgi:ergot alkaloid biosynthesis protein
MRDRILITGGTGKTGRRVAESLRRQNLRTLVASRSAKGPGAVHFDWSDTTTFNGALDGISAIYLVAPSNVAEPLAAMMPFLEHALESGVERFVLLSASSLEEGGPMMGAVHAWLDRHAPRWVVLRPTWFMQNFSEQQHLPTILEEGAIYSATGDGRVGFIDAEDIAATAAQALTAPDFPNGDVILTGPETLSYDDVAALVSSACGRRVRHHRLTEQELADRFQAGGMAANYAHVLAAMDTAISWGAEDRLTDGVWRATGRAPSRFMDFAARAAACWKVD